MEQYEQSYYNFQTQARGLRDAAALTRTFEKSSKWYARRLRQYLPEDRSARWLDVPCGYGNFLYFLRRQGYCNSTGLDIDKEQVALARLLDLPASEGDALALLSATGDEFDAIASIDFLEHLSRDRALEFLGLCFQRLAPGGVLILRTPCADGPFGACDAYNDLTHQWSMTSNVLRTLLVMHGFVRVSILDERPQPYNFVNTLRLATFYPARALASGFCLAMGLTPPAIWSRSMWAVAYKPQEQRGRHAA